MSGVQTNLGQFADGTGLPEPPLVILDVNAEAVRPPTGSGKIAGHIGVDKRRGGGNAYVSHKKRAKHYYRKGGGYALSVGILNLLMTRNVHTLYWVEDGGTRTLEYGIRQYVEDATPVKHATGGDPQVCVPASDARYVWLDHDPVLDARRPS